MNRIAIAERNAHIVAMYLGGMTQAEIAYEFFLDQSSVSWILTKSGIWAKGNR